LLCKFGNGTNIQYIQWHSYVKRSVLYFYALGVATLDIILKNDILQLIEINRVIVLLRNLHIMIIHKVSFTQQMMKRGISLQCLFISLISLESVEYSTRFKIDGASERNYDDGARRDELARPTFIRRSVSGLI